MEEEIDGIIHCIDGANGMVHSSDIPKEILENFDLWDGECQVLLIDVDLGNEWYPDNGVRYGRNYGVPEQVRFQFSIKDIIIL